MFFKRKEIMFSVWSTFYSLKISTLVMFCYTQDIWLLSTFIRLWRSGMDASATFVNKKTQKVGKNVVILLNLLYFILCLGFGKWQCPNKTECYLLCDEGYEASSPVVAR